MQVPKDFSAAVTAVAESMPRDVIANILMALGPRQPVQVKKRATDEYGAVIHSEADLERMDKLRKRRSPRGSGAADNFYVNLQYPVHRHKAGTWRRAMVDCVLKQGSAVHPNRLSKCVALRAFRTNSEYWEHADKGIDFSWCLRNGVIYI